MSIFTYSRRYTPKEQMIFNAGYSYGTKDITDKLNGDIELKELLRNPLHSSVRNRLGQLLEDK